MWYDYAMSVNSFMARSLCGAKGNQINGIATSYNTWLNKNTNFNYNMDLGEKRQGNKTN